MFCALVLIILLILICFVIYRKIQNKNSLSKVTNFRFYHSNNNDHKLVILFSWLFARNSHVEKYCKLVLGKGFDVLVVRTTVADCLIPKFGTHRTAHNLMQYLAKHGHNYEHYIFYAFSIGVYQMGELLVLLNRQENAEMKHKISHKLKGLIIDSAVDAQEATSSMTKVITINFAVDLLVECLLKLYYTFTYPFTVCHYIEASKMIKSDAFKCARLVYLSKNDIFSDYMPQLIAIEKLKQMGIDMVYRCWNESLHTSHFYKYPTEYCELLFDFLDKTTNQ